MANIRDHLKRWMEAGLIDRDLAGRIETWEARQHAGRREDERPGALEALLYLGLVVLGVGVFALFAQQWDELESWARVTAVGVPVALLLGVGAVLRFSDEPELERGSQAAWFVAVPLFAAFLGILFDEYGLGLDFSDDRDGLLVVASASFALALALWVFSPRHAQVVAFAGTAFFLGQAVGNWPDDFSQALAGMVILGIGLAGVCFGEAGWFGPRTTVQLFFGALCIAGPFEAGVGDGHIAFEFLAGLMAAGVVGLGVVRGSFGLVLVGVTGAFGVLVTFIFEHFSDELGAPLALMLSGGIMVAAVILLAAFRREIQARRQPA
jgi:hypothetical protein